MTARRSTAIARGIASLAISAVLLIGVPFGLATLVGWPLPTTIPDGDALGRAVHTGITDEVIVNTLAVIAWIAWAQIALAFTVEAVAAFKGRQPLDLPITPGVQAAVARLVAGIVLFLAPLQPARAVAAPAAPAPIVSTVTAAPEPVLDLRADTTHAASASTAAPATAQARTVTVQRHDSYWAIAERELGDGLRWREIQELNVGRTMPGGHVITAGDETLRSGWTLAVPAPAPSAAPATAPAAAEVVVAPGDNLWDISEAHLAVDLARPPTDTEVAPYWTDVIDANRDRLADPTNPSLIYPGEVLVLPPTGHGAPPPPPSPPPDKPAGPPDPAPEPEVDDDQAPSTTAAPEPPSTSTPAPTTTAPTTSVADSTPSVDEPVPATVEEADDADGSGVAAPWVFVAGGLASAALAVGAKRYIERRRRAYTVDHDGADLPAPDPEQRELHQGVVAAADEERIAELQYALGELSVDFADRGVPCRPRLVRHGPDALEVLLDQPATVPPDGWRADGDGLVLTLDHEINLHLALDGPSCPAPLMVTIGRPDQHAHLYLDLEADGVVALVGDVDAGRALARSMLTELALSPLGDSNRVITIGDLVEPDAAGLPQLTHKETWDDLATDLTAWLDASHNAVAVNHWPNAFVGRGHEPDHEALMPMVVVATKPPPPDLLDLIVKGRPSAVAIVVADEFDGALTTINCDPDEICLDDLNITFTPQQVDATELEDMGRLFRISDYDDDGGDHREGLELDDHDEESSAEPEAVDEIEPEPPGPPAYEILVRLLGDIHVEGAIKPMQPKATSVTAYLALNRSLTSERLEEACWFGASGTSHRKRLLETMTACRDALGSQHLPPNQHGTYTIGDGVRTDVELFDWHVAQAVRQDPAEAIESYRNALDLVTGRPFSYPTKGRASFGWVDFEHQATTWEGRIAGVAKAFAELSLDHGDPAQAITDLHRLLQAAPLNGGVVAALMRLHIETGDRSAADHLYQEHAAALDQANLGDPDDQVEQLRLALADDTSERRQA